MDVKNIVDLIVNNGVAIAVLAYFCIRDWKFMETLTRTLATLTEQNETIEKLIGRIRKEDEDNV